MILFPAIDLKDGRCVQLEQGFMERARVFNDDPADQARIFAAQGVEYLHLVDLNGSFEGRPVNAAAVRAILSATNLPLELGGGVRNMATVETWLGEGIRRVIVGTAAVRDPDFVKAACKRFPGQIALAIDARGGKVAVQGWSESTELGVIELAQRFEDSGACAIIYTDIDRDGVFAGLNVDATCALADAVSVPVVASGGVASIADIERLATAAHPNIEGVISGTAIYDGRLDIAEAMRVLRNATAPA